MAINHIPVSCTLVINVVNDKGTGNITKRYSGIKPEASDADLYAVANGPYGLITLQNRELVSVQRINIAELYEV